jgi:hypothetical protein
MPFSSENYAFANDMDAVSTNTRRLFIRVKMLGFPFLSPGPNHMYEVSASVSGDTHPDIAGLCASFCQAIIIAVTIAGFVVRKADGQRFACPRYSPSNAGIDQ